MSLRTLVILAAFACVQRDAIATSCSVVPVCDRVRPDSVLFAGGVIDPGVEPGSLPGSNRDAVISVKEIFGGLPADTKEVIVSVSWRIEKGQQYLFDVSKGADGHYYPNICGSTGEITEQFTAEFLNYLRRRAKGKVSTSLAVYVVDQYKPVPDAGVTITGPNGRLMKHTSSNGLVTFAEIPPARYGVMAEREHYHADKDSPSDAAVEVIAGTCPSTRVELRTDAGIAGLVRDAKGEPVGSLELELVSAPDHPTDEISLSQPFFLAKTNAEGRFSIDSVSPGKYLLGSNIIGQSTSAIPPTYYPGQQTRAGAVPIEVRLGETTGNLLLNLPEFGAKRQIELCVVDATGNPVASARIVPASDPMSDGAAGLGEDLATDDSGCLRAVGYELATYAVRASINPPGASIRQSRVSENVIIAAGRGSIRQVLKLGPPLGPLLPKPK